MSKNKTKTTKHKKLLEFDFKVVENKGFISIILFLDNSFLKRDNINIDNKIEN